MSTDSFLGLARAFSELQHQFADVQTREGGLIEQIEKLTRENADLGREIERAERDVADEKTKLRLLHGDLEGSRREKLRLEALLDDDREAAREQSVAHQKEITALNTRLNETNDRRRSTEDRLAHVTERYRALHAAYTAARGAHAGLQQAQERLSALEKDLAAQTNAKNELENALTTERNRVAQLVARCEAWQQELEGAGAKYDGLEKKFTEHRALIERWVHAYRQLEGRLGQVREAYRQENLRWQRFAQSETARAGALEHELRDIRGWIEKREDGRDDLQIQSQKIANDNRELAFRLEKALEENRALKDSQVRWQSEAELWRRRSRDAEDHGAAAVRRAENQLQDQRATFERTLENLRTENQRRTGRPYSARAAQTLEDSIRTASQKSNDRARVVDLIEKFSKDIPAFDEGRQPPPPPADALPKTK